LAIPPRGEGPAKPVLVMEAEGYTVIRFATTDVLYHLDGVHMMILEAIKGTSA